MTERIQTEHDGGSMKIQTVLLAIAINAVFLITFLLLFYLEFETNDDSGLEALVAGSRGVRDPHMVYSNYLLGLVLTSLFRVMPSVQWTAVLQYIILFISFTIITCIFFTRQRGYAQRILVTAVIFFFSFEGYVYLQYTKTAGIMTAAGLIAIFYGLIREKPVKWALALGMVLTLLGSIYRVQQALCEIALFSSLVLYCGIAITCDMEEPKKRLLQSISVGFSLILLIGGLYAFDRLQYSNGEWADYLEYDKFRQEATDYGLPKYSKYKDEYNEIGIDKSAYDLMKRWVFEDEERFKPDTFRKIVELREKKKIDASFIKQFLVKSVKGLLRENSFLCFALVLLCWLIVGNHKGRAWASVLLLAAVIAALYFYLFYAGRFMIHRVDVGIWFTAAVIVLFMFDGEENQNDAQTVMSRSAAATYVPLAVAICIVALFALRVTWADRLKINSQDQIDAAREERNVIEQINSDQEHLYLTKVGTVKFSKAYGALEAIPFCSGDNMYPLGGWTAETPTYKTVLKRFGVKNPFKEMVNNDKIFVVDSNIDLTIKYIRRWYYPDAKAELIDVINNYKVYRVTSGE